MTAFEIFVLSQFSSVVQSWSSSLRPHGLQHTRPPCPSPTPGVYSNSCPLSRWCHPTISSSVVPFSSCLWSFPASESFPMSQFFALGGQSIRISASVLVLPMNTQDWFPLGLTGLIFLQSRELSRVFSSTTIWRHNSSALSLLYSLTLTSIHDYWKKHSFDLVWFSCPSFVLLFSPWTESHKTIALFFAVIIDYLIIDCKLLRAEIMSCFCDLYVVNAQKMFDWRS